MLIDAMSRVVRCVCVCVCVCVYLNIYILDYILYILFFYFSLPLRVQHYDQNNKNNNK